MSREDSNYLRKEYQPDETSISDDVDVHDGQLIRNRFTKPFTRKDRKSYNGGDEVWHSEVLPPKIFK